MKDDADIDPITREVIRGWLETAAEEMQNALIKSAHSMLIAEAIRTAQKKYGNKPLTGEQVRWGFEHLDLTAERIKELGFEGLLKPLKFTCQDHQGADEARVHQWDGKEWKIISDFYKADAAMQDSLVKASAAQYAKEKNITPRDCSKVE